MPCQSGSKRSHSSAAHNLGLDKKEVLERDRSMTDDEIGGLVVALRERRWMLKANAAEAEIDRKAATALASLQAERGKELPPVTPESLHYHDDKSCVAFFSSTADRDSFMKWLKRADDVVRSPRRHRGPPPMTPDIRKALKPFLEARTVYRDDEWPLDMEVIAVRKIDLRRAREAWESADTVREKTIGECAKYVQGLADVAAASGETDNHNLLASVARGLCATLKTTPAPYEEVRKKTGYKFEGFCVATFNTVAGKTRHVVDNGDGLLHIFSPEQLERR